MSPFWPRGAWSGSLSPVANVPTIQPPSTSALAQLQARERRSRVCLKSVQSDSKWFMQARLLNPNSSTTPFWPQWRSFLSSHPPIILRIIAAIKAFRQELPNVPLVAVIETGPYRQMDEAATTYAVPYEWREQYGIRRYGFHGASHRSASSRTQALLGRNNLRHISCHLGGSSSIAAFHNGIAVDTSFGASPQSGLPQNNRVGDIDVFAVLHMMKKLELDPDQMAVLLGSRSGLAGISGTCGDLRDLTEAAQAGNRRSQLALDVFVRAIRHYVGAFMLTLGGIDAITFSGGIGENSSDIRAAVLKNLSAFGVELDQDRNRTIKGEATISTDNSPVKVLVVPANEEVIVARDTVAVVSGQMAKARALAGQAT